MAAAAGDVGTGSERLLQGRLGLGSCPLWAESSSPARRRSCLGRDAFCPFPRVGTDRLSELLEAPPAASVPGSRSQPCTPNGSAVRDGPGPRAEGSPPAGDSLTWRAGRPVPCGGWSEGWRGELGAGKRCVISGAGGRRGRRVQSREQAPASSAAPSAKGLGT